MARSGGSLRGGGAGSHEPSRHAAGLSPGPAKATALEVAGLRGCGLLGGAAVVVSFVTRPCRVS